MWGDMTAELICRSRGAQSAPRYVPIAADTSLDHQPLLRDELLAGIVPAWAVPARPTATITGPLCRAASLPRSPR